MNFAVSLGFCTFAEKMCMSAVFCKRLITTIEHGRLSTSIIYSKEINNSFFAKKRRQSV